MRRTTIAAALVVSVAAVVSSLVGVAPAQAAGMPAAMKAQYDHQYGTFTPFTKSGSRNATIVLPQNARSGIIVATFTPTTKDMNSSDADFFVKELNSKGGPTGSIPIGLSGKYTGRVAYGTDSWRKPAALEVEAKGQWTLKFSQVSSAPALTASGHGDDVMLYWGATATRQFRCTNTRVATCMLRETLLRNDYETIPASDNGSGKDLSKRITLSKGPSVLQLNAGSTWSIR